MTYSLEPDRAHVTCPLMHMKNEPCTFSNTRHIVVDLARLCGKIPMPSVKLLKSKTLRSCQAKAFNANEDSDTETATTVPSEGEDPDEDVLTEDEEEDSEDEDGQVLAARRRILKKRPSSPEFKLPDLS